MSAPFSVWFTGLPASGKSTLAAALVSALREQAVPADLLDGDVLRRSLSADLGFTPADREEHGHRVISRAVELAVGGVVPVVALISPYRGTRAEARERLPDLIEMYVRCARDVLESRDPKGLYARARRGLLTGLTGVDAPYEEPLAPEVIVDTDRETVTACIDRVLGAIRSRVDI